ncbi:MAG: hypothetical protein PHN75_12490 [Syntrophales bacterium]|nr:hypothetical protein [Syntrophales bacterium]
MKKIAIKFCGGCNPTFDRSDYWSGIKAAINSEIDWVSPDQPDIDALLLICGCYAACPEKYCDPAHYKFFIVIRDAYEPPNRIARKLLGEGYSEVHLQTL